MRAIEFAKARSFFAPGLKELAVRIEFQDARVVGRFLAVAIGHEDIAIESDRDFGWLVEGIQAGSGDAGLPKSHQNLAVLIEFKHLLPLAVLQPVVGNPQISVVVHANLVRADEQALTKTLEKFPGGLEFEDGIEWGIGAVGSARTHGAAAIDGPDVAVRTYRNARGRAPFSTVGQSAPAHACKIRIRQVVARAERRHRWRLLRLCLHVCGRS